MAYRPEGQLFVGSPGPYVQLQVVAVSLQFGPE